MKIRKQLTPDSWCTTKKHDKKVWALVRCCSFSEPMSLEEALALSGKWESYWKNQDRLLDEIERILDEPTERDASVVRQEIKDANKGLAECIEVMKERLKK